jgi:nicotinamide-nucleotide amidase
MNQNLGQQAASLIRAYAERGLMIAMAESCTGGLAMAVLTDVPGSSAVVERGFVTYSNEAKTELLGVAEELIAAHGAVSEPVARAMAEGAMLHSRADVAVAITGVAGPSGGTSAKPVGLVHFACARRSRPTRHLERRYGNLGRQEIRARAVADALTLLDQAIAGENQAASRP